MLVYLGEIITGLREIGAARYKGEIAGVGVIFYRFFPHGQCEMLTKVDGGGEGVQGRLILGLGRRRGERGDEKRSYPAEQLNSFLKSTQTVKKKQPILSRD